MPLQEEALPLKTEKAERVSRFFNQLSMPDIEGQPELSEIRETTAWVDVVGRALFGGDEIREAFVLTPKKQSKALPLDTQVVTPAGFSTIRELEAGEYVMAPDGKPTKIIGKSEVFIGRDCYEIEFSTGEVVIADGQHRWWVSSHEDRTRTAARKARDECWQFKTTAQLAERVRYYDGSRYHISNHRMAVAASLDLPDVYLPVEPYLFGLWLGDGTRREAALTVGSEDKAHVEAAMMAAGCTPTWCRQDPRTGAWTLRCCGADEPAPCPKTGQMLTRAGHPLLYALRSLGVTEKKHIPAIYQRASQTQRLALLQGLLDSDGHVNTGSTHTGGVVFSQSNRHLVDDFVELASSLGFKCQVKEHRATMNGKDCGPTWRVLFAATQESKVFRLGRKLNKLPKRAKNWTRSRYRQVVAIRQVPSVPTQCITVDSPSEQFLLGRSMLPTGNTTSGSLLYLAAFLANEIPNHSYTIIAPTVAIASFAFDTIRAAIQADGELNSFVKIRSHIKEIEHLQTGARISVKALSLQTLTGLRGSVFFDEIHVAGAMRDGQKLRQQLRGALASNPSARALYITTQSDDEPAGIFRNMLNYARQVRDGTITDASFLPVLYEPWPGCDPWNDESVWKNLMPSYPHIAGPEFYRAAIAEANASGPSAVAEAKSQYFNIEIGAGESGGEWSVAAAYGYLNEEFDLEDLIDSSVRLSIGVDLGGSADLTALAVLGVQPDGSWKTWIRGWITPDGLKLNVKNMSRFDQFRDENHLVYSKPGQDVSDIVGICTDLRDIGKLNGVGVDPAGAADLADALEDAGFVMEENLHGVGQSAFRLAPAVRTIERKAERGTLTFATQPLMGWALGNIVIRQKGNAPAIEKQYALDRIDPVAALLDAVIVEIHHREEPFSVQAMIG